MLGEQKGPKETLGLGARGTEPEPDRRLGRHGRTEREGREVVCGGGVTFPRGSAHIFSCRIP